MKESECHGSPMILLAVICLLAVGAAHGAAPDERAPQGPMRDIDLITYFDANTLLMFITNVGSFAYDDGGWMGRNDGLYFPRPDLSQLSNRKTAIYAAGLWVGAEVDGEIRVAIAAYSQEYVPGPMAGGTYQPDHSRFHVYKINEGDTRWSNPDYADWPFDDGAPAVKNSAGDDSIGTDGYRIPLILGKQALWTVFNDANPLAHNNHAGNTAPLGVEVQLYAYGDDLSCEASQTVYLHYTIINKGSNALEDAMVSLWTDPDLGGASDDLAGCDTLRSLGYCYNDGADAIYGASPPAVGIVLLQGPIVPAPGDSAWVFSAGGWIHNYRNLAMSAFAAYINGFDPDSPAESFNYMHGLDADGTPFINPVTGFETKYKMSGDPVAGTGWIDEMAADKRFMLNCGPLTMAPGDTQEVVAAVIIGAGEAEHVGDVKVCTPIEQASAISEIKRVARVIKDAFPGIPLPTTQVAIDILPGQCPNRLQLYDWEEHHHNPGSLTAGVRPETSIPVAILGHNDFDVMSVDPPEVLLEGVTPSHFLYRDVAAPIIKETPCDCHRAEGDGYTDLLLIYNKEALLAALETGDASQQRRVNLSGKKMSGQRIAGDDCLYIPKAVKELSIAAGEEGSHASRLHCYPNPFNAHTVISFSLPQPGRASLAIFDVLGRRVTVLVDDVLTSGPHRIEWDGTGTHGRTVPSGMYFCRLTAEDYRATKKMVVLK